MQTKELKKAIESAIADWQATKPEGAKGQWKTRVEHYSHGRMPLIYLVWEIDSDDWPEPRDHDAPFSQWGGFDILKSLPQYSFYGAGGCTDSDGKNVSTRFVCWLGGRDE